MSAIKVGITIRCDDCGQSICTALTTVSAARRTAARYGWHIARLAGGQHIKPSANPKETDLCGPCWKTRLAPGEAVIEP